MFPRAWSCYLQRLLRICYVIFPSQLQFALWYARLKLSYKFLQILIRETGIADYYNIILLRLNLEVHIFHCSRGGRLAALVGVSIVWNLEPLASGSQSSHKLIPHIICQFLYAWGKTLNEDLLYKGPSASLPRLHTCENKVPFLDFKEFTVTVTFVNISFLPLNCIPCFPSVYRLWVHISGDVRIQETHSRRKAYQSHIQ